MHIYRYPSVKAQNRLKTIVNRGLRVKKKDIAAVERILEDVRKNGDRALVSYARRFDCPAMQTDSLKVTQEEFDRAATQVDRSFVQALNRAVQQIESFHRRQLQQSWMTDDRKGTVLGQLVRAVGSAGVYVPGGRGGKTPLVSSVLMGAIPAQVAGVARLCMVTPPTKDGDVAPHLLVAAKKVGVDTVYKVGSAWAIAAMAYGTESIPRVDVIVGPGNIHVTLAKKIVSGSVGIDMVAGPSEILVIADAHAHPDFVAADLLSQAEHDVLASSILVTDSQALARAVSEELETQMAQLPRKDIAAQSMAGYGAIFCVKDIPAAISLANDVAPEHLELQVADPFAHLGAIENAGAVFLGVYTPEPVGDYIAGPNHVLPTAGTARFSSALSVDHFLKKTSLIYYNREAFRRDASSIIRLAQTEGLEAHARSVGIRIGNRKKEGK